MVENNGRLRQIGIFCGSNVGSDPAYREAAEELGRQLGERGLGLVYGAGNVGLMGVLADAALAAGARVTGVIPHGLVALEVAHQGLDELIEVDTMHERKRLMYDRSDALIAMPGGLGTLDELFESLTWNQLGIHAKPCGLLDVAGYYDPLMAMLDRARDHGFVRAEYHAALLAEKEPGALLDRLASFRPPSIGKWAER